MNNAEFHNRVEHIDRLGHDDLGEELDTTLTVLAERVSLAPEIVEGYRADTAEIYFIGNGNIDSPFATDLLQSKLRALALFERYHTALSSLRAGDVPLVDSQPATTSRIERRARLGATARRGGRRASWASPQAQDQLKDLQANWNLGVFRSDVLASMMLVNRLNYYPLFDDLESNPDLSSLVAEELAEEYRQFLDDAEHDEVPEEALVQKLVEKGHIDFSEEGLTKRFNNYRAVSQLAMANFMLSDIAELAGMQGNQQERALMLFNRLMGSLEVDDWDGKIALMREVGDELAVSAANTRQPVARQTLNLFAKQNRATVDSLTSCMDNFGLLYEKLGFKLPDFFRAPVVDEVQAIDPDVDVNKELESGPQPEVVVNEELIADIRAWHEQILNRADVLTAQWLLSSKELKRLGCGNMERELTTGATNHLGVAILNPIPRAQTREIISILYKLSELSNTNSDIRLGQQLLNESLRALSQTQADASVAGQLASDQSVEGLSSVILPTVEVHLSNIRSEWPGYRQVIQNHWPNYEGATVAHAIERLLFAQELQPGDEPELNAQSVELLAASIAEQLDKIILPPGAGRDDLVRELMRLGESKSGAMRVQWERLQDIITLCDAFGGDLYRSKQGTLGNAPPYFVAVVTYEGETYAVAESPVFGNATYVVAQKHVPGTWLEVLELTKRDARGVGANKIVHPKKPDSAPHIDRVYDKIMELHLVQGLN